MTQQELLDMGLHEIKSVSCPSHDIDVMRVFGGWVYTTLIWDNEKDTAHSSSMCFVPEIINIEGHLTNHY